MNKMNTISHHTALIYTMVIVSAADGSMSEKELKIIGELTKVLPAFIGFDHGRLLGICQECAQILQEPDGADAVMGLIDDGLPDVLHETAYWVALEVALADRRIALEEVRMLDALRRRLEIDKLTAAAIERGGAREVPGRVKRLLLLRHAKTEPAGPGIDDHARALMARGREDAPRLGRYIEERGYTPDLVLASTATRTIETVELATENWSGTRRIDYLEALYLAEPDVILSIVRLGSDAVKSLMVVGHNPGLERLATALAREPLKRKEKDRFDLIEEKFPTAALAVLDFDAARWRDVAAGEGKLTDFVRPRDL